MAGDEWRASNLDWSSRQDRLFLEMAHDTDVIEDRVLQQMFHMGWYDQDVDTRTRMFAREWVQERVQVEYGFDFDQFFSWEAWREAYGEGVL